MNLLLIDYLKLNNGSPGRPVRGGGIVLFVCLLTPALALVSSFLQPSASTASSTGVKYRLLVKSELPMSPIISGPLSTSFVIKASLATASNFRVSSFILFFFNTLQNLLRLRPYSVAISLLFLEVLMM